MSTDMSSAAPVDFDPFAGAAIARVAPTTQPQREIWLADRLSDDASLAYNESISLRLSGTLNVGALLGAVQDVVAAHEALRATFSADGQQMLIAESVTLDIPALDLSALDAAGQANALAAARTRAVSTKFDLEAGPLVRAELLACSRADHTLVFTAHHVVCDGWSFGVIVRDLAAFYAARLERAPQPASGDSFVEYAESELQHAASDAYRTDEAYWIAQFQSSTPTLDLPTDRPRKARRTFASRRLDVHFDADLTAQIRRFGAQQGAGLPAALIGLFSVLLHRIAGAASVVVGMPAAGQSIAGATRLVGHCVNLLPLRFDLDAKRTAAEVVAQARSVVLDAYEHQRYTFGALLQKLTIARDPGRLPLVSVLFNVDQALDPASIEFPELSFEFSANPRVAENFEMFVNAVPAGGGLRLEVQYNCDLFDESAIRRWFDAYETLLRAAIDDGAREVAHLPLVSEAAHEELAALQPAATTYEADVLMHEFIERQVDRTPDAVALTFGESSLTYAQVEARANRIAHALRRLGVQRGVAVGLCVNRSLDMVASIIGILKAGGVHVPLDPSFPAERLTFMTSDSALGALISESEYFSRTGVERAKTLLLDADNASLAELPADRLPRDDSSATPDFSAYIIYTSGSTGRPKGVQVPHRAIANLFASLSREPGLDANDTLVAVTTISFDIAVFELMLPLTLGARIVIAARDQVRDAGLLRRLLEESRATVMQATPAGWRLLLESGWRGHSTFKAISGGEPLAPDLARALLERCGSVWNGYGPTETTVYSTFWRVEHPEAGISIGRPIANTTVWILDEQQQPCPLGVPGEICIGGDGVTLGYLNRPELNAERFLQNRFDGRGRIYRTGDRGRWLSTGVLEHLGRLDFQVKVRGYRVELGEIEANLLALPAVKRAVAMAREDRPGDVRLVAYVVPEDGAVLSESDLRSALQTILPEYFVPQHFVVLPAIPLLPNGKVDRKALPAPENTRDERAYVAPRNELEQRIAAAMEDVLGLPGVSIHDDFFALGGHSLLAAQLTARLNRELQARLTLRTLFDAPTIARLADAVRSNSDRSGAPQPAPIAHRAEQRKAPLSIMQERLWFLEQLHPGRVVYNTPSAHRLRGRLNIDAFNRAFLELMRYQPSLRTAIAVEDGVALQVVHENVQFTLLPIEDLTSIAAGTREAELRGRLDRLVNEPFNLTVAPLFRARLFRLADDEHVLLFVPHHIIWDGWSFDLFYAQLAAIYEAFLAGKPNPLPPLPISYGDFAVWHRKWLEGPEFATQIRYWRERLADISDVSELPADKPRRPGMSGEGCTEWLSVDKATTEALRELSRKSDVTLFMTLLAIYYVLLHRASGQQRLVIGTPVRGRNLTEVEQVMGYFTNLLPLPLTVDSAEPFVELVKRVKTAVLDSFAHPDVPLEMLLRELTVQRGEGGSLLYQALFSFQDARHRISNWGGLSHEQVLLFQRGATEDLGLWFLDNDHGMVGGVTYNADIISADSARLLRERYMALVRAVLAAPQTPVGELDLRVDADRPAGHSSRAAARVDQEPELLHREFEIVVDAAGDAPATIVGGWSTSFRDIELQANRIANTLRARGVATGDLIALCEEPGQGFLSALLGILKAGAACVLVDGASRERLSAALRAANARGFVGASRFKEAVAALELRTLWLDLEAGELISASSARCDSTGLSGDSIALLFDCSTNAEAPRFVAVSHRRVRDAVLAVRNAIGLQSQHRCLVGARASIPEWLLACTAGASCVIASSAASKDAAALARDIEAGDPNVVALSVEQWEMLIRTSWRPKQATIALITGARPDSETAEQLTTHAGGVWRLWESAELGLWTTLGRVRNAADTLPIGEPIGQAQLRVIDQRGDEAPLNFWGALHIGWRGEPLHDAGKRARRRPDGRFELQTEIRTSFFDEPHAVTAQAAAEHVDPQTPMERLLAEIWCELLGASQVSTRDNFFDLGGHSLLAMQAINRMEQKTGRSIAPRRYMFQTLAQLAASYDEPAPPQPKQGLVGKLLSAFRGGKR